MIKKISIFVSVLFVTSMLFTTGVSASAGSEYEITSRNERIIDAIQDASDIQSALSTALADESPMVTADMVADEPTVLNTVLVDAQTTVSFYSDGTFTVSELITNGPIGIKGPLIVPMATTINYTNTVSRYGPIGNTLYTISVTGYFTGSIGNVPTPVLIDAYYTRGFLSMWQVSDWQEGGYKTATEGVIYGRGNFHYGLEVKGVGLVIQEIYENVRIWLGSDWGTVYGSN